MRTAFRESLCPQLLEYSAFTQVNTVKLRPLKVQFQCVLQVVVDEEAVMDCLDRHPRLTAVADFSGDVVAALIARPSQASALPS